VAPTALLLRWRPGPARNPCGLSAAAAFRADLREVRVLWGPSKWLEPAGRSRTRDRPPALLLPAVARRRPAPVSGGPGSSFCEWKGPACYWSLIDAERRLRSVAWSYPKPLDGAEMLASAWRSMRRRSIAASMDAVTPQPGGFYGAGSRPSCAVHSKGARQRRMVNLVLRPRKAMSGSLSPCCESSSRLCTR